MTSRSNPDVAAELADTSAPTTIDRRKLIRAGLAATPVLMGLKSESALATGTETVCKPSMWSSIKAAGCRLSRQVIAKKGTCTHYSNWKTSSASSCSHKFHAGYRNGGTTYTGAGFDATCWASAKTVKEVCGTTDSGAKYELSRHCAAIYLQIQVYGASSCPISLTDCKNMWTACKDGGTYAPAGSNVKWKAQDCIEYLSYVCGKEIPASC